MSSHHIIREDQEPALVIDDASAGNFESIQQLLEWSPTVIVTERALEQVLTWGIKIDVAIVPEDGLEKWKFALHEQAPVKILTTATNDARDTALHFLIASKQKSVNIISGADLETFEGFKTLDLSVIRNGKRWVFIRSGHFEKWLPAGTALNFHPRDAHPELPLEKEGLVTITRDHSFWVCEIN
ncbi:MAG TPA: hypothetical protein PK325_05235 [Cyclobacteriaceae bacterium]|nr:hypothetical protein [Cyclobacteriaceae bacterium]HMV08017.1 hypothetical protein [Cyclobacteriaceae bacterium]HMV91048.1 hypothetical protein [Cyclobacteriaceae bacterium]HMX00657.1 hypothetical protein [Cyclobacteriaceae bacterium]HMX49468.1 hypothetical protein [Cyclobacteriaceae bacterium]